VGTELITTFSDAIAGIKADVLSLLGVIVEPALLIFGIIIAIMIGKRAFRVLVR
jgi:hypothetical protein